MNVLEVALLILLAMAMFAVGVGVGGILMFVVIWIMCRLVGVEGDLFDAVMYTLRGLMIGSSITVEEEELFDDDDDD